MEGTGGTFYKHLIDIARLEKKEHLGAATYLCPKVGNFTMNGIKGTSLWIHSKAGIDPRRREKNFVDFYQFGKFFDSDDYLNNYSSNPYKAKYQYDSIFFDYTKASGSKQAFSTKVF